MGDKVTDRCKNLPHGWVTAYLHAPLTNSNSSSPWPQLRGGIFTGTQHGFRSWDGINSYEAISAVAMKVTTRLLKKGRMVYEATKVG